MWGWGAFSQYMSGSVPSTQQGSESSHALPFPAVSIDPMTYSNQMAYGTSSSSQYGSNPVFAADSGPALSFNAPDGDSAARTDVSASVSSRMLTHANIFAEQPAFLRPFVAAPGADAFRAGTARAVDRLRWNEPSTEASDTLGAAQAMSTHSSFANDATLATAFTNRNSTGTGGGTIYFGGNRDRQSHESVHRETTKAATPINKYATAAEVHPFLKLVSARHLSEELSGPFDLTPLFASAATQPPPSSASPDGPRADADAEADAWVSTASAGTAATAPSTVPSIGRARPFNVWNWVETQRSASLNVGLFDMSQFLDPNPTWSNTPEAPHNSKCGIGQDEFTHPLECNGSPNRPRERLGFGPDKGAVEHESGIRSRDTCSVPCIPRRYEENMCDLVAVAADGGSFGCHRLVLGMWSAPLRKLVGGVMSESRNHVVMFRNADSETLGLFLGMLYGNRVAFPDAAAAMRVAALADMYGVARLVDLCASKLTAVALRSFASCCWILLESRRNALARTAEHCWMLLHQHLAALGSSSGGGGGAGAGARIGGRGNVGFVNIIRDGGMSFGDGSSVGSGSASHRLRLFCDLDRILGWFQVRAADRRRRRQQRERSVLRRLRRPVSEIGDSTGMTPQGAGKGARGEKQERWSEERRDGNPEGKKGEIEEEEEEDCVLLLLEENDVIQLLLMAAAGPILFHAAQAKAELWNDQIQKKVAEALQRLELPESAVDKKDPNNYNNNGNSNSNSTCSMDPEFLVSGPQNGGSAMASHGDLNRTSPVLDDSKKRVHRFDSMPDSGDSVYSSAQNHSKLSSQTPVQDLSLVLDAYMRVYDDVLCFTSGPRPTALSTTAAAAAAAAAVSAAAAAVAVGGEAVARNEGRRRVMDGRTTSPSEAETTEAVAIETINIDGRWSSIRDDAQRVPEAPVVEDRGLEAPVLVRRGGERMGFEVAVGDRSADIGEDGEGQEGESDERGRLRERATGEATGQEGGEGEGEAAGGGGGVEDEEGDNDDDNDEDNDEGDNDDEEHTQGRMRRTEGTGAEIVELVRRAHREGVEALPGQADGEGSCEESDRNGYGSGRNHQSGGDRDDTMDNAMDQTTTDAVNGGPGGDHHTPDRALFPLTTLSVVGNSSNGPTELHNSGSEFRCESSSSESSSGSSTPGSQTNGTGASVPLLHQQRTLESLNAIHSWIRGSGIHTRGGTSPRSMGGGGISAVAEQAVTGVAAGGAKERSVVVTSRPGWLGEDRPNEGEFRPRLDAAVFGGLDTKGGSRASYGKRSFGDGLYGNGAHDISVMWDDQEASTALGGPSAAPSSPCDFAAATEGTNTASTATEGAAASGAAGSIPGIRGPASSSRSESQSKGPVEPAAGSGFNSEKDALVPWILMKAHEIHSRKRPFTAYVRTELYNLRRNDNMLVAEARRQLVDIHVASLVAITWLAAMEPHMMQRSAFVSSGEDGGNDVRNADDCKEDLLPEAQESPRVQEPSEVGEASGMDSKKRASGPRRGKIATGDQGFVGMARCGDNETWKREKATSALQEAAVNEAEMEWRRTVARVTAHIPWALLDDAAVCMIESSAILAWKRAKEAVEAENGAAIRRGGGEGGSGRR